MTHFFRIAMPNSSNIICFFINLLFFRKLTLIWQSHYRETMQRAYQSCLILLLFATVARAQNPCDIIVSVNKGCVPLPVQFTFSTTNTSPEVSYHWDFGDGDSSSQASPTYAYTTAGSYTPKVTVVFQNGTKCTVSLPKPISV